MIDNLTIAKEWDKIVPLRIEDFKNKSDYSYENILKPCFINITKEGNFSNILDLGCGSGYLTKEISKYCNKIIGIDISEQSINLAKENFQRDNIEYIICNITNYQTTEKFSLIISNMVLMDAINLNEIFKKAYELLKNNGRFIFTITHPAFWPIYKEYSLDKGFNYLKPTCFTADFKITGKLYDGFPTTHIHRPIQYYIKTAIKNNFKLNDLTELKDASNQFWFPRFILFEFIK